MREAYQEKSFSFQGIIKEGDVGQWVQICPVPEWRGNAPIMRCLQHKSVQAVFWSGIAAVGQV